MEPDREQEPGSDEQLGDRRLADARGRLDLQLADELEEDRRTATQPVDGPG